MASYFKMLESWMCATVVAYILESKLFMHICSLDVPSGIEWEYCAEIVVLGNAVD